MLAEAHRTLASAAAARDAVAAFRRAHPGVEIRLRYAGSGHLVEQIRLGRLNAGFVALPGPAPDGVRLLPLATEEMVLLCHPGHRLAGQSSVDLAALVEEEFVDLSADWGARRVNDQTFARADASRRVSIEVNDVHTLLGFVHQGLGVALVPAPVTHKPHAKGRHVAALPGHAPSAATR